MGMKTLKPGEDFSFPREFGFSGSVSPRAHPTMSQDEFGDDAQLNCEAETPTFAKGGKAMGGPTLPGGKPMPKAGKAIMGALQLGKVIGQATAAKGGGPAMGAPAPGAPPAGLGALPRPGAGVIPGGMPGTPPGGLPMKKGGKAKWAAKAFKPSHKGELHRALDVPEGEKIPAGKMESAVHSKNPHVRHMAQAARNINK